MNVTYDSSCVQALVEENQDLRRQLSLSRQTQEELAKRNNVYQKTIKSLVGNIVCMLSLPHVKHFSCVVASFELLRLAGLLMLLCEHSLLHTLFDESMCALFFWLGVLYAIITYLSSPARGSELLRVVCSIQGSTFCYMYVLLCPLQLMKLQEQGQIQDLHEPVIKVCTCSIMAVNGAYAPRIEKYTCILQYCQSLLFSTCSTC